MSGKLLKIQIVLCSWLAVQIMLTLLGDGLYFTSHEADMLHLADLVLRQSAGDLYHTDISTPIGAWATLPMALLHRAGLGLGAAMMWAQVIVLVNLLVVAALTFPNRLTLGQSFVAAAVVAGLGAGLVFGGLEPIVSLSMSYNRWCWAASVLVVLVVLLPGQRPDSRVEGLVLGLLMAEMAMIKVVYPVALALPVIVALLRKGRIQTLLMACIGAFAVLAAITVFEGVGYWHRYLADLLSVTQSEHRVAPGVDWPALILSPSGLPATLVVVAIIVLAGRLGRRDLNGPIVLFFAAFTLITWQNFGNDPIWLAPFGLVAWVLSTQGQGSAARAMRATALAAGVLILPVMLNILWSPVRHLTTPADMATPFLPGEPDLRGVAARLDTVAIKTVLSAPNSAQTFRGTVLPECEIASGLVGAIRQQATDLRDLAPNMERQPIVADIFQAHWLFAGLAPLPGGAPWYYSGLPGLDAASHVVVPMCPASLTTRAYILGLLDDTGITLDEVGQTDTLRLYAISPQE